MKIRGVIFDFDGVVNDSFREGLRRIRNLCVTSDPQIEFTPAHRRKLTELWGLPGVDLMQQGLGIPHAAAEALYKRWEAYDLADPVPLITGADDVLYWLHRNTFHIGLLTSRNRDNIRDIFEKIDLTRRFDIIATRQESPYRKPDPRVFEYVLGEFSDRFGIGPEECIFVGDTPADIDAGTAASITTLLVQTGPYLLRHADKLPIALSNVLHSIDDLPMWLEEHQPRTIKYPYI